MISESKKQIWGLFQQGQHSEVVKQASLLLQQNLNDAELQYILGCSHAKLQEWTKAEGALQQCVSLQPGMAQSFYALAGVQLAQGKETDGINSLNNSLAINANNPDALVSLGNVMLSRTDIESASQYFQKALKISPQHSNAYLGLAKIERNRLNFDGVLEYVNDALKYNENSPEALCLKGSAIINLAKMSNEENIENAIEYYVRAIEIQPGFIDAQAGLALIYEFTGEYDKTMDLITPLIEKGINNSTLAVVYARLCKHFDACDDAIRYVDTVLNNLQLHNDAKKTIHYAAGRALDNQKKYDDAFQHYKNANNCGVKLYDSVAHFQNITNIISTFTPELFMRMPKSSNTDDRPVFIVGMPRSGTSLTEQIFSSHSKVYGAGELKKLNEIMLKIPAIIGSKEIYPHYLPQLDLQSIDRFASEYLNDLDELAPDSQRITDKMPHNFFMLGLIQLFFPKAHVIHIKRDAMDTCLSIFFQDFSEGHSYSTNLFNIGTHYNQYERLMKHWKNVLSLPILDVAYEDLVSNQEQTTQKMLEFCGLEWDENCSTFYKTERTINTPSYDQVRQPMYNKSVNRWRNYEKYLDDLKRGLTQEY